MKNTVQTHIKEYYESKQLPAGVATNRRDWRGAIPSSATVILVDRVNTPTDAQVYTNQQLLDFLESYDRTEGLALVELRSDGRSRTAW